MSKSGKLKILCVEGREALANYTRRAWAWEFMGELTGSMGIPIDLLSPFKPAATAVLDAATGELISHEIDGR